ncbi:MAG: response regulator transcription factor [Hahellaceae bacterium]|jgi:two-component system response regulator RegA|nr:response regulator transcription factor [Hahellaceae bacterium]MCP5209713.1 response regulator transcription factor [Hahellaceae bacterium]
MTAIKMLIVDDDQVFADTLARAFGRRGLDCRQCYSLADADVLLQDCAAEDAWAPEQAVVDLKIGNDSGLTLVQQLAQQLPACKTLVLTGYSSIATAVDAIKLGAINYLPKPANADEILLAFDADGTPEPVSTSYSPPSVDRLEWEHIQRVLRDNNGNISATARALNMHRRTLQRKLQKKPVRE